MQRQMRGHSRHEVTVGRVDPAEQCLACRAHGTLIPIGERADHPHRWRPWVTTVTQICACSACGEIVQVGHGADTVRTTRAFSAVAAGGWDTSPTMIALPPAPDHCTSTTSSAA